MKMLGTGNPMGNIITGRVRDDWEKWQIAFDLKKPYVSYGVLGALHYIGYAFIGHLEVTLFAAATYPVTGILARKLFPIEDMWMAMEGLRAGFVVLSLSALYGQLVL